MTALIDPPVDQRLTSTRLTVNGMRCAACIAKVERGLRAIEGVAVARVNLSSRRVTVVHEPALDPGQLAAAIETLGFDAHLFAGSNAPPEERERKILVQALAVAGFAAMNIMLLSVSVWSGADGPTRTLFHWLSALIALPTIAYAGRPFFVSAWAALRNGRTNMDVPISIGVLLTAAVSLYETSIGGEHAYFDGAVMLLFFLLTGRYLDSAMRARAQDGIAALLRSVPVEALVVYPDGAAVRLPVSDLAVGMAIRVAAGERIAADGIVLDGVSAIDCALVTGESIPEPIEPGGRVLAGTINLMAPLTIRADAVGNSTAIADIARLMESAGQGRSRYVRIADRASRLYAPAVHTLAALSFIGWLLAGAGPHQALSIAVAVLIITCPCALGLAVPMAQVVVCGALMKIGVLVRDGSALEQLDAVDTVLLDKTGTTTLAQLSPTSGMPDDLASLSALLTIAQASSHPLAQAAAEAARGAGATSIPVTGLKELLGLGIEGAIAGVTCRLGRPDWVTSDSKATIDRAEIAWRMGAAPATIIKLEDEVRADAAAAVGRLRQLGLRVELVSGDAAAVVTPLAAHLGIEGHARMTPGGKADHIADLQAQGHSILMVGDGLNDGPALRAAHVAMAPATASDVGTQAADIVFVGNRLMPVPLVIAASRRTMRVVRQNFVLAITYNAVAVPLAIGGLVTPLIAAAAMSVSSLLVIANALRLRRAAR